MVCLIFTLGRNEQYIETRKKNTADPYLSFTCEHFYSQNYSNIQALLHMKWKLIYMDF